jgi:hypothetical protein
LEFGAVVCLDDLHWEGQSLEHVVNELDRGFLIAPWVDAQYAQSGAVVDCGELAVLSAPADRGSGRVFEWLNEFDVDVNPMPGQLLLIALPIVCRACSAGASSRLRSRRLRIRQTPELDISTS